MFGIFSRGTKVCSREDFKYCCLQRLDLKREISDRELSMFLENKLGNKANITQKEFVTIFSGPIGQAREEVYSYERNKEEIE